jgi:hypothetical protein
MKTYLKFDTVFKVLESFDVVNTERDYLKIWHFFEKGQVLQIISPKIEIFNSIKVIVAGFGKN